MLPPPLWHVLMLQLFFWAQTENADVMAFVVHTVAAWHLSPECLQQLTGTLRTAGLYGWSEMAETESVCRHDCCVKMEIWFVIYEGSISQDWCVAKSLCLPHSGTYRFFSTVTIFSITPASQTRELIFQTSEQINISLFVESSV